MEQDYSKEFPFSQEFQYAILKLMIIDDVFMIKCVQNLKEEYFNDKYLTWTFRTIVNYWDTYKKSPSISTLENEARKNDPETQKYYFDTLKAILNVNDIDEGYMRRELTGFVRRNIFVDAFKRAATLYNAKNTYDAYNFTKDKMDELTQVNLTEDDIASFKNIDIYMNEERRRRDTSVPTGISAIDEAMQGGLAKGALSVLLSSTNSGKSMSLINMIYHAIMAGKKIVFVEHEDQRNPTMLRIISRFTGIPYNKLMCSPDVLSGAEKDKIQACKDKLDEFLVVKFMYGSDVYVEDVVNWLKLKKKEFNFDMFVDDYGQFIRTKQKFEAERMTQMAVHKILKQTALELDIAVLTCAQGTREAQKISKKGTDYLRSTDLSECFDIARRADNVITLNRSDEQAQRNELIYYLEKQRHGIRGIAVKCFSDYTRCITHDIDRQELANSLNPLLSDPIDTQSGLENDNDKSKM